MPCYDSRNDPEASYDRGYQDGKRKVKRAGKLTRLLCAVYKDLDGCDSYIPDALETWYQEQEKIDRIGNARKDGIIRRRISA